MRITVVGAYGYTGKIICRLLDEASIPFAIAGRNETALEELFSALKQATNSIAADTQSEKGIQQILDHSDLIINCAGPFTEESQQFIQAVALSGKKYLDITGEIGFVRDSKLHNENAALQSGALLIHGCAFESLVAGLAIQQAASELNERIAEVQTFYHLGNARPSPGTKLTMKLARFRDPLRISEGKWSVSNLQNDRLKCEWKSFPELTAAVPYPLPEIAFSHWELQPVEVNSFLLLDSGAALFINANQNQVQTKEEIIALHRRKKTEGPDEQARQNQTCNLIVSLKSISGKSICNQLSGSDMYLVTAKAILFAVQELQNPQTNYAGVISPALLFRGRESEILNQLGFTVQKVSDFSVDKY